MTKIDRPRDGETKNYRPPHAEDALRAPSRISRALRWLRANPLLSVVTVVVGGSAIGSTAIVLNAVARAVTLPTNWLLAASVFVFTAATPQFLIELMAIVAERLAPQIPNDLSSRWFRNTGAFVGMVERPLLLGSLVAGRPEFVGVWLVFKSIAGYRYGLTEKEFKERRLFQLFLLNNAMSLSVVALGWLAWMLLALPRVT